jgi:glycosyltransferase involved in cell wall biosynthesis
MRLLFLARREVRHPDAGGSEVLVDRLARGMVERGHRVELLCGGPTAAHPYRVTSLGDSWRPYLRAPLQYLSRHREADLVVDVANGMTFLSPLWRRRPSLCLVNHIHRYEWGLWFPPPVAAVGRAVETRVMPAVYSRRLFVAVSASTASSLVELGVGSGSIRIVHNGVDLPAVSPQKSPEPLFAAVGRLVPQKRFDLLLRMWERVRPLTGGSLVIAGDGPERGRLQALAGPGVTLRGWVSGDDKDALLGASWLLLHPAAVEGWGQVVLEAAARGTPALGFDVCGVRDSVADGHTGLLARSENDFCGLWVSLASDHARRLALGTQACRRAARYSWTASVDAFEAVAEEALVWRPGTEPDQPLPPVATVGGGEQSWSARTARPTCACR